MRNFLLTNLLLILFSLPGQSQKVDTTSTPSLNFKKDFSFLVGFNQGKYGFAELGIAINYYGYNRHPFTFDYFASNEIKLDKNIIVGPKIGMWIGGGFAMGLNFIYYTDFSESSLVFRPEIGLSIEKLKIVYGYNWNWTKLLPGLNRYQASVVYCFMLKRLKSSKLL